MAKTDCLFGRKKAWSNAPSKCATGRAWRTGVIWSYFRDSVAVIFTCCSLSSRPLPRCNDTAGYSSPDGLIATNAFTNVFLASNAMNVWLSVSGEIGRNKFDIVRRGDPSTSWADHPGHYSFRDLRYESQVRTVNVIFFWKRALFGKGTFAPLPPARKGKGVIAPYPIGSGVPADPALTVNWSAYRHNHSTETALVRLYDDMIRSGDR